MACYALAIPRFGPEDAAWVEGFRRLNDPFADAVPAHVTLVFGAADPHLGKLTARVSDLASRTGPFDVVLRDMVIVPDDYSGDVLVQLLPHEGADALNDMHEVVHDGPLGDARRGARYQPHVTIGRFENDVAAARAAADLGRRQLAIAGRIEALTIVQQTAEALATVATFDLIASEWRE